MYSPGYSKPLTHLWMKGNERLFWEVNLLKEKLRLIMSKWTGEKKTASIHPGSQWWAISSFRNTLKILTVFNPLLWGRQLQAWAHSSPCSLCLLAVPSHSGTVFSLPGMLFPTLPFDQASTWMTLQRSLPNTSSCQSSPEGSLRLGSYLRRYKAHDNELLASLPHESRNPATPGPAGFGSDSCTLQLL